MKPYLIITMKGGQTTVSLIHMYGFSTNMYGDEPMQTIEMKVKGMSCKSCSNKIEKALSGMKGVEKAEVNLAEDKVSVSFNPQQVEEKTLKERILEIGYCPEGCSPKKGVGKGETKNTLFKGIAFGLVPHIGCIGFIVATILGVTVAAEFFKPLLMNAWFFYGLIALSIVLATISSLFYLSKNELLSFSGIKKKKGYLAVMYGTTIGVSMLFLFVVFPMLATASAGVAEQSTLLAAATNGNTPGQTLVVNTTSTEQTITLSVQIPCGGHTPLITSELKKLPGILSIKTSNWNTFVVTFDTTKTTQQQILQASIFKSYSAKVL